MFNSKFSADFPDWETIDKAFFVVGVVYNSRNFVIRTTTTATTILHMKVR